jgi:Protein of unknown function (DUF2283)
MANGKFELNVSEGEGDVAYLSLPAHPGRGRSGIVAKQIRLRDLYGAYEGPDVYFDFDKDNQLLGIEIL